MQERAWHRRRARIAAESDSATRSLWGLIPSRERKLARGGARRRASPPRRRPVLSLLARSSIRARTPLLRGHRDTVLEEHARKRNHGGGPLRHARDAAAARGVVHGCLPGEGDRREPDPVRLGQLLPPAAPADRHAR